MYLVVFVSVFISILSYIIILSRVNGGFGKIFGSKSIGDVIVECEKKLQKLINRK